MNYFSFDTMRLNCRPLKTQGDYVAFSRLLEDPTINTFFGISNGIDFLNSLRKVDCYPLGIFQNNVLIGYLNGYRYEHETLLVECFFDVAHRNQGLSQELIEKFMLEMTQLGFFKFKFDVEELNAPAIASLRKLDAVYSRSFKADGKDFRTYEIYWPKY